MAQQGPPAYQGAVRGGIPVLPPFNPSVQKRLLVGTRARSPPGHLLGSIAVPAGSLQQQKQLFGMHCEPATMISRSASMDSVLFGGVNNHHPSSLSSSAAANHADMNKSSFYVWFLGAVESGGLWGEDYMVPAVKALLMAAGGCSLDEGRASSHHLLPPPSHQAVFPSQAKVTLQVSNRGLKIVQVVPRRSHPDRMETVKQFIPDDAVTCVMQHRPPHDDVVSCILLMHNPVTGYPAHIHVYRCDSPETASFLRDQLEAFVRSSDHHRRLVELEAQLDLRKGKPLSASHLRRNPSQKEDVSLHDDRARRRLPESSSTDAKTNDNSNNKRSRSLDSSSGGGSGSASMDSTNAVVRDRISSLYDSLAAELREKLAAGAANRLSSSARTNGGNNNKVPPSSSSAVQAGRNGGVGGVPLLLPPRDYDTMHRSFGKLEGIEERRSRNPQVVGVNRSSGATPYYSSNKQTCARTDDKSPPASPSNAVNNKVTVNRPSSSRWWGKFRNSRDDDEKDEDERVPASSNRNGSTSVKNGGGSAFDRSDASAASVIAALNGNQHHVLVAGGQNNNNNDSRGAGLFGMTTTSADITSGDQDSSGIGSDEAESPIGTPRHLSSASATSRPTAGAPVTRNQSGNSRKSSNNNNNVGVGGGRPMRSMSTPEPAVTSSRSGMGMLLNNGCSRNAAKICGQRPGAGRGRPPPDETRSCSSDEEEWERCRGASNRHATSQLFAVAATSSAVLPSNARCSDKQLSRQARRTPAAAANCRADSANAVIKGSPSNAGAGADSSSSRKAVSPTRQLPERFVRSSSATTTSVNFGASTGHVQEQQRSPSPVLEGFQNNFQDIRERFRNMEKDSPSNKKDKEVPRNNNDKTTSRQTSRNDEDNNARVGNKAARHEEHHDVEDPDSPRDADDSMDGDNDIKWTHREQQQPHLWRSRSQESPDRSRKWREGKRSDATEKSHVAIISAAAAGGGGGSGYSRQQRPAVNANDPGIKRWSYSPAEFPPTNAAGQHVNFKRFSHQEQQQQDDWCGEESKITPKLHPSRMYPPPPHPVGDQRIQPADHIYEQLPDPSCSPTQNNMGASNKAAEVRPRARSRSRGPAAGQSPAAAIPDVLKRKSAPFPLTVLRNEPPKLSCDAGEGVCADGSGGMLMWANRSVQQQQQHQDQAGAGRQRYTELSRDRRFPGLDRDSARLDAGPPPRHHHQQQGQQRPPPAPHHERNGLVLMTSASASGTHILHPAAGQEPNILVRADARYINRRQHPSPSQQGPFGR